MAPRAWGPAKLAIVLGACAALVEIALGSLVQLGRPASHLPAFLVYYWCASAAYLAACWSVVRTPRTAIGKRGLAWIWAAAVLFRLTLLPLSPSLSEDATRYRWQGMMQDAGGDPYTSPPLDPRWQGLRDITWEGVSSKDKTSAYGPVIEQVNVWHYRLVALAGVDPETQVWLFKLPFAIAELAVGLALMALLAAAGRPLEWVLIYLWCPLAVVEFWAEGHNDAPAVALTVQAVAFHLRQKPVRALVLLAAATMCKFWPVVLLPLLALSRGSSGWVVRWRGLLAGSAVGLALCLPYWRSLPRVVAVLDGFGSGWRNNDSLYSVLLWVAGGDPDLAASAARLALVGLVLALCAAKIPTSKAALAAVCALLLLSANCFPWYLSWMLPLLAVHPSAALLLWTALAPLGHHVVQAYEITGSWEYDGFLILLEYLPVLGWLGLVGVSRLCRSFALGAQLEKLRRE